MRFSLYKGMFGSLRYAAYLSTINKFVLESVKCVFLRFHLNLTSFIYGAGLAGVLA